MGCKSLVEVLSEDKRLNNIEGLINLVYQSNEYISRNIIARNFNRDKYKYSAKSLCYNINCQDNIYLEKDKTYYCFNQEKLKEMYSS